MRSDISTVNGQNLLLALQRSGRTLSKYLGGGPSRLSTSAFEQMIGLLWVDSEVERPLIAACCSTVETGISNRFRRLYATITY